MKSKRPLGWWLDLIMGICAILFVSIMVGLITLYLIVGIKANYAVIKWIEAEPKIVDLSEENSETINVSTDEEKSLTAAISGVTVAYEEPVAEEPAVKTTGTCGDVLEEGEWVTYIATAYCPNACCCGEWASIAYKATASGAGAVEGVTIAMGESYPFGTHVYIEGMGEYIVQDRGSAIDDSRIDIYFETHEDACKFGMREVRARVIKED